MLFASAGLVACDNNSTGTTENEGTVIHKDSVASEYEVTETVVERDTTTNTRTVDVDRDNNNQ